MNEEWFEIEDITLVDDSSKLYCLAVDSPEHQFLVGNMGIPTHNTDAAKEADELKGEAKMIIGSIARLGRAAGVHLVIATQRPDAELIPGETRDNLAVRIGCGTLKPSASQMLFGSNIGARTPSNPPGGIYIQIHGKGNRGQGFFAQEEWLQNYYDEHEQTNVAGPTGEDFEEMPDSTSKKEEEFDPLQDWDESMDDIMKANKGENDD